MTYKQLETSREIRLWATQIIIPAFGLAYMACPKFKEKVDDVVFKKFMHGIFK